MIISNKYVFWNIHFKFFSDKSEDFFLSLTLEEDDIINVIIIHIANNNFQDVMVIEISVFKSTIIEAIFSNASCSWDFGDLIHSKLLNQ